MGNLEVRGGMRSHEAEADPACSGDALVVGPDDWAVRDAVAKLSSAGHRVHRCSDSAEAPFPCRALQPGAGCPLDTADVAVVLDVRSRPRSDLALAEMGVVCGLRAGLPLVAAGVPHPAGLAPWATEVPVDGDVVTTCERVMRVRR